MLCENCGTECDGNFCPKCGKPCLQGSEMIPQNTSKDVTGGNSSEIENASEANQSIESTEQSVAIAPNQDIASVNQNVAGVTNENIVNTTNQNISSVNQNVASQNINNIKPVRSYIEKQLSGFACAKSAVALVMGVVLSVFIWLLGYLNFYDEVLKLTISGTIAVVLGFFGVALFLVTGVSQYEKLTRNSKIRILIPFVLSFAGPVAWVAMPWLFINLLTLGLRAVRQKLNKEKNSQTDYAILCNYTSIFADIVGLILLFSAGFVMLVEGIRFNTDGSMYNLIITIFGGIVIALSVIATIIIVAKNVIEFVKLNGKNTKLSEVEFNAVEGVVAVNKKCYKKLVAMTLVVSMVMAVVIPISAVGLDKFTRCKYIDLSIGYSEVERYLGEPDVAENGVYEYYSDNYLKLAQKIEKMEEEILGLQSVADDFDESDFDDMLDDIDKEFAEFDKKLKKIEKLKEKLNNLNYKYIRIEFNTSIDDSDNYYSGISNGKIKSIYYDSRKCDAGTSSNKQITNIKIDGKTTVSQYESINIKYTINYKDNSFYMGGFCGFATNIGDNIVDLPLSINVIKLKKLTSDAVDNILSQHPNDKKLFVVPESVEVIESEAFYNTSVETIYIGENIKHIQKNAFNSDVKNIIYNGTKAEWKKVKKDKSLQSNYDNIIVTCSDGIFEN